MAQLRSETTSDRGACVFVQVRFDAEIMKVRHEKRARREVQSKREIMDRSEKMISEKNRRSGEGDELMSSDSAGSLEATASKHRLDHQLVRDAFAVLRFEVGKRRSLDEYNPL